VWVGFDDNRDFKLEGAHSALPIWGEFMKRAHEHPEYKDVKPFEPPEGVISVDIDPDTGERATSACPKVHTEVFVAGTEPTRSCRLHGGGRAQVASWEPSAAPAAVAAESKAEAEKPAEAAAKTARKPRSISLKKAPLPEPPKEEPKKGFWDRVRGIFGSK